MKRGKALLAIFSAGLLLTACGNPSEKGVEYLEKGEYDQAVEQFEQAIEKNKNTGDAWRGIGIVKWEQKDYKGARNAFRKALDNNAEKTGTIYNLIGNCDLKLGKAKEALNYYNLGLEQDDVSKKMKKEMKYNIIVAYEKMEDWESAEVKLEEYLETAPNEFAADVQNDTASETGNEAANGVAGDTDAQNSAQTQNTENVDQAVKKSEKIRKTAIIYSPVNGIAADLSTAPDEGFAGKMMGDGAVVTPTEGTVYAPADGEVEFIFDTKHAIGFQTDSGIPMLLHMGIDTVKLEGKGFEILVTEGQKVKKGDPMMKLDLEFLTANAPSITSPILDTEPEDNQRIRLLANGEIKAGEPLFAVETLE